MPLCITAGGNASPRSETCTKLLETKLEIPSNRKWCIQCLQTPIKPDAKKSAKLMFILFAVRRLCWND